MVKFSQYYIVCMHEPVSFWHENMIAFCVVVADTSCQMLVVLSFCDPGRA